MFYIPPAIIPSSSYAMYLVHSSSMIIINVLEKKKKANQIKTKHRSWPDSGKRVLQPLRLGLHRPGSLWPLGGQRSRCPMREQQCWGDVTAASPTHCLPGKRRGLAGAEGKGRLKHNTSNRKQLENLFSIYVSTHRGGGKLCGAFSCC